MCGRAFAPLIAYTKSRYRMITDPWRFCEECNAARLGGCKTCAFYSAVANPRPPKGMEYRSTGAHCRYWHVANPVANRPFRGGLCPDWKRKKGE